MYYKKEFLVVNLLGLTIASHSAMAGQPLFTFTPKTSTSISVYTDQSQAEQIQYRITNTSKKPHKLQLLPLPQGFSQVTTGQGRCGPQFALQGGQFCNLVIAVTGTQLGASATVKPQVCQVSPNGTPSPYLCYQSSAANAMNVTLLPSSTDHAMLTISTDFLALSVNNTTLNAALTLTPRTFTITNNGPAAARNIAVSEITSLPTGTTLSGDCSTYTGGTQLASSGTCTVTVNPGSTSTVPSGSTPDPTVLLIAGENTSALTPEVDVLTYGNFYQQGYVFAFDNSTSASVSVGGTLAAVSEYPLGTPWGNPNITTNATSVTDGITNTATINAVLGASPATPASICTAYEIDSSGNTPCSTGAVCYDNWFLPALCQLVNEGGCTGTQGMANTLSASIVGVQQTYWASTEVSTSQAAAIIVNSPNSYSVGADKTGAYNFRCTRPMT